MAEQTVFDFDKNKSRADKKKHGVDFIEAQRLWEDENRLIVPSANNGNDDQRNILFGQIEGKVYAAIYTERGETIRIISVRRARRQEEDYYNGSK